MKIVAELMKICSLSVFLAVFASNTYADSCPPKCPANTHAELQNNPAEYGEHEYKCCPDGGGSCYLGLKKCTPEKP